LIALISHLEECGHNPLSADLWAKFVGAVVGALLAAETSLKSEIAWSEFCAATGAFGVPRKRGLHAKRCLPTEEGISGELAGRMNDYLRATDDDHILRKWHVTFESEGRVRSRRKKGKYAARTDIRACALRLGGPEFVLEAKLVDTIGEVRSRLLGPKGLGCFISDEPYTTSDMGGLVAYTVRGDLETWLNFIETSYALPPAVAPSTKRVMVEPNNLIAVCAPVERRLLAKSILMLNIVLRFDTKPA
jgi:hypothetical protein